MGGSLRGSARLGAWVCAVLFPFGLGAPPPRPVLELRAGKGIRAESGDGVAIRYKLDSAGGEEIISNRDYREPMRFVAGKGTVPPWLEDGVKGMAPGGLRRIALPNGQGTLDLELLEVTKPPFP